MGKQSVVTPENKSSASTVSSGILQRKCNCGKGAGLSGKCEDCGEKPLTLQRKAMGNGQGKSVPLPLHDFLRPRQGKMPLLQPKLKSGRPGVKYEKEADRSAEQVMRMPEPQVQRQMELEDEDEGTVQMKPIAGQITPLVQRQMETEVDDDEEEMIQPKRLESQGASFVQREMEDAEEEVVQSKGMLGQAMPVAPNVANHIQNFKGGGQPLSKETRNFFEPRFGYDFSQVRVHINPKSANTLNARAYTSGSSIVFNSEQYKPGTKEGRRLLAHELTHICQQNSERSNLKSQKNSSISHVSENILQRKPNKTPYSARIRLLKEQAEAPVCQSINKGLTPKNCPVKLKSGTKITVTKEYVGGAWLAIRHPPQKQLGGQSTGVIQGKFVDAENPGKQFSGASPKAPSTKPREKSPKAPFTESREEGREAQSTESIKDLEGLRKFDLQPIPEKNPKAPSTESMMDVEGFKFLTPEDEANDPGGITVFNDYIDNQCYGIASSILMRGYALYCYGLKTPLFLPDSWIDLSLSEQSKNLNSVVYSGVYPDREQAIASLGSESKSAYAYWRIKQGGFVLPTLFSPASTPRISEMIRENIALQRASLEEAEKQLKILLISKVGGKIIQTLVGRILRWSARGPKSPPRKRRGNSNPLDPSKKSTSRKSSEEAAGSNSKDLNKERNLNKERRKLLGTLRKQKRKKELGDDPEKGYIEHEGEVGSLIEERYGGFKRDKSGDAEWISVSGPYQGKTFDLVGIPKGKAKFHSDKLERFLPSVDSHFRKSLDFVVLDIRYMTLGQKQTALNHVNSVWSSHKSRLILLK